MHWESPPFRSPHLRWSGIRGGDIRHHAAGLRGNCGEPGWVWGLKGFSLSLPLKSVQAFANVCRSSSLSVPPMSYMFGKFPQIWLNALWCTAAPLLVQTLQKPLGPPQAGGQRISKTIRHFKATWTRLLGHGRGLQAKWRISVDCNCRLGCKRSLALKMKLFILGSSYAQELPPHQLHLQEHHPAHKCGCQGWHHMKTRKSPFISSYYLNFFVSLQLNEDS